MPETEQSPFHSPDTSPVAPWQKLVLDSQQHAMQVATDIMTDSVLGESLTRLISDYLAERDKLAELRRRFAAADILCRDLRKEAKELMKSFGHESGWDANDIRAVDEQLLINMSEAAENAGAINSQRAEAAKVESQLHLRVVDEMAMYSSIAVLRTMGRFSGIGHAFCVAFVAMAVLREQTIEDVPLNKALLTLSDWLQYATGIRKRSVELDFFVNSRVAEQICSGMGIESSIALKQHLADAVDQIDGTQLS